MRGQMFRNECLIATVAIAGEHERAAADALRAVAAHRFQYLQFVCRIDEQHRCAGLGQQCDRSAFDRRPQPSINSAPVRRGSACMR